MSDPGEFDLFDPALVAAHDDAREMWQSLLPPPALRDIDSALYELRLDLSPVETLTRWVFAHVWADEDVEAAWAKRNAEDHLRRVRPAAMADYDRLVAGGVVPFEALRAVAPLLRDGPVAAPGGSAQSALAALNDGDLGSAAPPMPDWAVEAALFAVHLDWEQRGVSPQWRAVLGGGYVATVYRQWRTGADGGFEASAHEPDSYQWAIQRWAPDRSSARPWDLFPDDPLSVAGGDAVSAEAGRQAAEAVLGAVWGADGTASAAQFLEGHPDFACRVLTVGPIAANRAAGDEYLATHPKFAARVAAHGAELAERYGAADPGRLAAVADGAGHSDLAGAVIGPQSPIGASGVADDPQVQEPPFQPRWPRRTQDLPGPAAGL